MKKMLCLLAAVAVCLSWALAQPYAGKRFEFSTAASVSNIKYADADDSTTIFNLHLRLGVFLWKGLQLEPEILLTVPENDYGEDTTGVIFVGNILYNFNIAGKVVPFILAGAGYGNAQKLLSWAADWDAGISVLNFGLGIKYFLSPSAALRIDYRFTTYSGTKTETYSYWGYTYSETYKLDRTDNEGTIGISILF